MARTRNSTTTTTSTTAADSATPDEQIINALRRAPDEQIINALRRADPDGTVTLAAGVIGRNRKDMSAAVPELERVIRNLSCDLSEARLDVARLQQERWHHDDKINRVVDALEWLRDTYDLDQIAVDVITHAIVTASSQTRAVSFAAHVVELRRRAAFGDQEAIAELAVLTPELERVIRNLSCDLSEARLDVARLQQERWHHDDKINRVVDALEWLRDTYDLDQIAVDVITHAIVTASSQTIIAS